MEGLYLGQEANYWLELESKAKVLDITNWLEEIADLRGKVSFYESRIIELNKFMKRNE